MDNKTADVLLGQIAASLPAIASGAALILVFWLASPVARRLLRYTTLADGEKVHLIPNQTMYSDPVTVSTRPSEP